jgi:hypothetical protein
MSNLAGRKRATATFDKAKKNKNDEFYTQLSDIEAEMRHYRKHFKGKTIFCNCDDPYESNFFRYFAMNFNFLGLKKLIMTSYAGSPVAGTTLSLFDIEYIEETPSDVKQPYKVEITEVTDENSDGAIDLADVEYLIKNKKNTLTLLEGDGDFRSDECVELLKGADIVVTNPPFSLFREYVAQLVAHKKKFIIIGNKGSISYKEIFMLIKDGQMWLGHRNINQDMWFIVPEHYECEKVVNGLRVKHIMACWFTNLDLKKRHEDITLYKRYTPEEYPKYVNYDAIEVSKTAEIPYDYDGEMGVPITFLDKHNPEQFEIIGSSSFLGKPMSEFAIKGTYEQGGAKFYLPNGDGTYRRLYDRIVIKRKGMTP